MLKKNKINNGNRSCQLCGFFVYRLAETAGNLGFCLFFDDIEKRGESLKIPIGEERSCAEKCPEYFRKVRSMSTGEFLSWRTEVATYKSQRGVAREARIITFLAFLITLAEFCRAFEPLKKLLGG